MKMPCRMWCSWALPPQAGASQARCHGWCARSVGDRFERWDAATRAQRANLNAASLTSTYQILLFGCRNPRGAQQTDDLADVIWHWIGRMVGHGIILDWPGGAEIITPLNDEQRAEADVLGVVVAKSHDAARPYRREPALLGDTLPNGADDTALAALCLPLTADIQRAMMVWEIARLAARAIGLDLPVGR